MEKYLKKFICLIPYFNYFLLSAVIVTFILGIYKADILPDGSCYLSVGDRIADGWVLYKDMITMYTPLAMYSFGLISYLLGNHATYGIFIGFILLLNLGSSFLGYAILSSKIKNKPLSILGACFIFFLNVVEKMQTIL